MIAFCILHEEALASFNLETTSLKYFDAYDDEEKNIIEHVYKMSMSINISKFEFPINVLRI